MIEGKKRAVRLPIKNPIQTVPLRGSISYHGSIYIPAGAFDDGYQGPCPPAGQVHTYEWSVDALDANRSVLADGKATEKFPVK